MKIKTISLLLLSLVIYGCATMNANECTTANWQAIGYEDGNRGYGASRFGQHRKACAKHGVSADFSVYKQGYDQGVRSYCTPERGYSLGKRNSALPNICPNDLIASVRRGYDLGHNLYLEKKELQEEIKLLNKDIAVIDADIEVLNEELSEHEEYLQIAEAGLKDPKVKRSERLIFYTQRAQMRKLIREKQQEIDSFEEEKQPYYNSIENLKADIRRLDNRPMPPLR
ncbi:MAG: DUF2799 domain-containing protein [Cellvibrionaceae bacterium]